MDFNENGDILVVQDSINNLYFYHFNPYNHTSYPFYLISTEQTHKAKDFCFINKSS